MTLPQHILCIGRARTGGPTLRGRVGSTLAGERKIAGHNALCAGFGPLPRDSFRRGTRDA